MKQDTIHRPTSHLANIYTEPFLWLREEKTDVSLVGWMISMASICYGDSGVAKHF